MIIMPTAILVTRLHCRVALYLQKKIKPDDYASNIPGKDTSIILLSPDRLIRHAGKLPLSLIHRQDFMQILMQISSVDHVTWDVTKTIVSHATGGTTCPDNEI